MSNETEPAARSRPKVRLAFARLLFRLSMVLFLLVEMALWSEAGKLANPPALPRWAIFFFYSPRFLFIAFMVAAGCTIAADLIVRLIIRPAVLRWHAPSSGGEAASFHLGAFESVIGSSPARRRGGWSWGPGMLVRTNTRLWFFPDSSDHEPLCLPAGDWSDVKVVEAPRMFLGMVRDLPDYVRLTRRDGVEEIFALADPGGTVAWLDANADLVTDRAPARRAERNDPLPPKDEQRWLARSEF
ncbi:hypothetical protein EP7_004403 [Isosphaeraceae bacterium EP7]